MSVDDGATNDDATQVISRAQIFAKAKD
jgi:hypothetical protein